MADVAVAPGVRTPGLYMLINLLAAAGLPGAGGVRGLLIAQAGPAGTITPDTAVHEAISGPDAAAILLGQGTPGHLAAKAIFTECPNARLDLVAPTPGGGVVATGTITFDDGAGVLSPWVVDGEVAGRPWAIAWLAGETDIQAATKAVAAINALGADIPVIAANGGGSLAVVTLTAKGAGPWGNDVVYAVAATGGSGGTVVAAGDRLTGGTVEPSIAAVLSLVSGREYDYIGIAGSNADAAAASATSGPGRLKTHIDQLDQGGAAKLQQGIAAHTGAISAAKTGAAQHNFGPLQITYHQNGRSLPAEFMGAEMGARMREEAIRANVNRVNTAYRATLYGSKDRVADDLTPAETEDLLYSGITPTAFNASNEIMVVRPVTSYFKDSAANADGRLLDVGKVSGTYAVAKDLRSAIPAEFPNRNIIADVGPNDGEPPDNTTQVYEVKAFIVSRLRFFVGAGVVRGDLLTAAVADGSLVVRINPSDDTQVDVVIPLGIVPIWAKTSLVINRIA